MPNQKLVIPLHSWITIHAICRLWTLHFEHCWIVIYIYGFWTLSHSLLKNIAHVATTRLWEWRSLTWNQCVDSWSHRLSKSMGKGQPLEMDKRARTGEGSLSFTPSVHPPSSFLIVSWYWRWFLCFYGNEYSNVLIPYKLCKVFFKWWHSFQ